MAPSKSTSVTSRTAPFIATARQTRPATANRLEMAMRYGLSRGLNMRPEKAVGAMKSAEAAAAARSVTKYTSVWKSVTVAKRCWNGTARRNANSTCTPGIATRSSLRSWSSWRLSRSSSVSTRSEGLRSGIGLLLPSPQAAANRSGSGGGPPLRLGIGGGPQSRDRLPDDARDLHLADAHYRRDLALPHDLL